MSHVVTHLLIGLRKGGAETMLYQVLKYQSDPEITHRVISFGVGTYYENPIRALGVSLEIVPLFKRPVISLYRVFQMMRHTDTLCCWMYHANFIGYLIGKPARVPNIIWSIRHSSLDPKLNKKRTLKINQFCAKRSNKVSIIAYNGNQARAVHEAIGYCHEKGVVLDNGCDCDEYAPLSDAKTALQTELHLPATDKIILSVTKNHPIKDVPTFIAAFGQLHKEMPDTVAVLCGDEVEPTNETLMTVCTENGLTYGKNIFLLGMRQDVPLLMAACDLYALHSAGEAFPNALLQAMACGCLCVTTDVGDARRLLNRADCTVSAGDAKSLCDKMRMLLLLPKEKRENMRIQNRNRVLENYDIHQIVKCYEALFNQ